MLPRIVHHEWRNLAADRTLGWVTVLFAAIVVYGVWNGAAWARGRESEAREARAAYEKRIAELRAELRKPPAATADPFAPDPRAPRTVGGVRQDAFLPPAALGALSVGQSDLLPSKVTVTIMTARRMLTRNYEVQNPLNLLTGRFDLAFAIVYLFPLLILALSYDLLSGERDQGTLGLLLSQPIALQTLVWGKVLSRFLVVVGLGASLSLLGILVAGSDLWSPATWPRLGMWVLAVVLYGAFWFGLAVFVSVLGRSSATSAVLLASLWLGLVVVLPSLVGLAASSLYPVPSRALLVHAMREATNEADRKGSQLLEKYFQDHPDLTGGGKPDLNDFTTRRLTVEQDIEARVAAVLERHDEALRAQQRMVSRLRVLSPAIAVQDALNDIAGTGPFRQRFFLDQAWDFAEKTRAFFVPRIFRREALSESDYDALPQFRFVEEPSGIVARRVLPGLAGVFLSAVGVGWLALGRLRRYPVAG
jgi:ABC-2 type transport system permease protein